MSSHHNTQNNYFKDISKMETFKRKLRKQMEGRLRNKFVTQMGPVFRLPAPTEKVDMMCCGIILLHTVNMYHSHRLIQKLIGP